MSLSENTKILVADDDEVILSQCRRVLQTLGCKNILEASTTDSAVDILNENYLHLAIVDLRMPDGSGQRLLQNLAFSQNEQRRQMPIIVIYGLMNREERALLAEFETARPIMKPFLDDHLAQAILKIMQDSARGNLKFDETDHETFTATIRSAIRLEKYDVAEKAVVERIRRDERSPRLLSLLADIKFLLGDLESASKLCDKVISVAPDNVLAHNVRAKIAVAEGDLEKALRSLTDAQKISPLNTHRMTVIGEIHLGFGRIRAAEEKFKKALAIDPTHDAARIGLVKTYIEMKNERAAKDEIARVARPEAVISELNLKGIMLASSARYEQALQLYEQALVFATTPKSKASIYYNMAIAMVRSSTWGKARDYVEKARPFSPPSFRQKLAQLDRRIANRERLPRSEKKYKDKCLLTNDQVNLLLGRSIGEPSLAIDPSKYSSVLSYDDEDIQILKTEVSPAGSPVNPQLPARMKKTP